MLTLLSELKRAASQSYLHLSIHLSTIWLKKFTVPVTDKSNPGLFHTNNCKEYDSHVAERLMATEKRR